MIFSVVVGFTKKRGARMNGEQMGKKEGCSFFRDNIDKNWGKRGGQVEEGIVLILSQGRCESSRSLQRLEGFTFLTTSGDIDRMGKNAGKG